MSLGDEEHIEIKSKSQLKKEAESMQKLGEKLIALTASELEKIPLDEKLLEAIRHAQTINTRGAIRRQRQYIGRLMRETDTFAIQQAYERLVHKDNQSVAQLHLVEQLRDKLIAQGDDALNEVIAHFPNADRRHIRQLVRNAKNELGKPVPPKSSRKLFKYLRHLADDKT